jgi:hypothetical protein
MHVISVITIFAPISFVIGILIGRSVYGEIGERRKRLVVIALVTWVPFWDLLPGYIAFRHAAHKYGGVRIHERVKAQGYLDLDCSYRCETRWTDLAQHSHHYLEVYIERPSVMSGARPSTTLPILKPGYYQFFTKRITPAECQIERHLPDRRSYYVTDDWKNWSPSKNYLQNICVIAQRTDRSRSRYQYTSAHRERLSEYPHWLPIWADWRKVTDRKTSRVIAQSYRVYFRWWFLPSSPIWSYDSSEKEFLFNIPDVIQPF